MSLLILLALPANQLQVMCGLEVRVRVRVRPTRALQLLFQPAAKRPPPFIPLFLFLFSSSHTPLLQPNTHT